MPDGLEVILDYDTAEEVRNLLSDLVRQLPVRPSSRLPTLVDELTTAMRDARPPHYCGYEFY